MTDNTPMYDDDFYCLDLVIMVENRLFKVPRRLFDESPIFGDMFAVPQAQNMPIEGGSDSNPLRLDGVAAKDFKALLGYLFPLPTRPAFTVEGWTGILRLANMWNFARAQHDAIDALDGLVTQPERRIQLARDFDISAWLAPALRELVMRAESMGTADVALLGIDWVLKIAALREKYGPHLAHFAASVTQEMIHSRNRSSMHHARSSASSGFNDVIVPGPSGLDSQERVSTRGHPQITQGIIETEFGLAKR